MGSALAAAAVVVAAIGFGVSRQPGAAPAAAPAHVEMVVGAASVRAGDPIATDSQLETDGRSRVALRLAGGHSVRLDVGTRARVISDRTIALDRGALYVDSRGAAAPNEIRTALGSVRDIGTQFEVGSRPGGMTVRVRAGRIVLDANGRTLEAGAGRELHVANGGRIASREAGSFGAALDWVGAITPMRAIDGRPLQEFLDWTARERGLRLRFGSPALAASASAIVLSGSIEGLTVDEALASVLATCGMSAHVRDDALVIAAVEQGGGR
jgi:ferric-dicitrate binding protein FerR (iron transport regulator)